MQSFSRDEMDFQSTSYLIHSPAQIEPTYHPQSQFEADVFESLWQAANPMRTEVIWVASSSSKCLNREQFNIALRLIAMAQKGETTLSRDRLIELNGVDFGPPVFIGVEISRADFVSSPKLELSVSVPPVPSPPKKQFNAAPSPVPVLTSSSTSTPSPALHPKQRVVVSLPPPPSALSSSSSRPQSARLQLSLEPPQHRQMHSNPSSATPSPLFPPKPNFLHLQSPVVGNGGASGSEAGTTSSWLSPVSPVMSHPRGGGGAPPMQLSHQEVLNSFLPSPSLDSSHAPRTGHASMQSAFNLRAQSSDSFLSSREAHVDPHVLVAPRDAHPSHQRTTPPQKQIPDSRVAPASSFEEEEVLECVICMMEFNSQNPMASTRCACGLNMALFHYDCLRTYLQSRSACPTCDQPLIVNALR